MKQVIWKPRMGWDKVWHFCGCLILTIGFLKLKVPPVTAVALISTLGLIKEGFDYYGKNHCCEVWDFVADATGAATGAYIGLSYPVL